ARPHRHARGGRRRRLLPVLAVVELRPRPGAEHHRRPVHRYDHLERRNGAPPQRRPIPEYCYGAFTPRPVNPTPLVLPRPPFGDTTPGAARNTRYRRWVPAKSSGNSCVDQVLLLVPVDRSVPVVTSGPVGLPVWTSISMRALPAVLSAAPPANRTRSFLS